MAAGPMELPMLSALARPQVERNSGPDSLRRGRLVVSIKPLSWCPNVRRADTLDRISWYSRTLPWASGDDVNVVGGRDQRGECSRTTCLFGARRLTFERRPSGRLFLCRGRNSHLDRPTRERFNRRVFLYALVAADSDFAIDVFVSRESAADALREVLFDEPGFAPLLTIVPLPPPWLDDCDRALEVYPQ